MSAGAPSGSPDVTRRRSVSAHAGRLVRGGAYVWREMRRMGCNPLRRLVIFDVGANDGSTFYRLARILPWIRVYAFEPTPYLAEPLQRAAAALGNYHVFPVAVGETSGRAIFNIAGEGDWGCSSLLTFSDGLDRTWPGRTDFRITERVEVDVVRLDDIVASQGLGRIDFLHVDAQGTDLQVLRSLGDHLEIVRAGVIEVPQSREVMLYKGQHSKEEACDFLRSRGFEIWRTVSQQNEDNLYFRRTKSRIP